MSKQVKWSKVAPRHWKAKGERWTYELSSIGTSKAPLYHWRATYRPPTGEPDVVLEGDCHTMPQATRACIEQKQPALFA